MWLLFSDLHLDMHKQFAKPLDNGLNTRIVQQIEVVKKVIAVAKKKRVSQIFFLGDFFESITSQINKLVYNIGFYLCQSLAKVAPLHIIVGNHDVYSNVHIYTPYTSIKDTYIYYLPTTIELENRKIDIVPYNEKLQDKNGDYCFGHFFISEALDNLKDYVNDHIIKIEELKEYKLVCAGHLHQTKSIDSRFIHIGSVMATSFKDLPQDRGIWLLDCQTDKIEFYPIASPKFLTYHVYKEDDIPEFNDNDYYKLIVHTDGLPLPELKTNVIVENDFVPQSYVEESINKDYTLDIIEIIMEFIDNSNTALPKDKLKEKARELMQNL